MNTTHPALTPVSSSQRGTPRHELYTVVHKALRLFMGDTLARVGTMDVTDDEEREQTLDQLDTLLAQLNHHLQHENDFLHTAIEARRPGGARHTAEDHLGHLDTLGNLEDQARALRCARAEHRAALALALYRQLAVFVAENMEHMQLEERDNQAALWSLYSDAELVEIHDRLLASIPPAEMALWTRWFALALNAQEVAGLFGEMQKKAPPEVFAALLDIARLHLPQARYAKLARALGLPPVPGLMIV